MVMSYTLLCLIISYSIMIKCWEDNPKLRPTFSKLVGNINRIMESMAGYLDISTL